MGRDLAHNNSANLSSHWGMQFAITSVSSGRLGDQSSPLQHRVPFSQPHTTKAAQVLLESSTV